MTPEGDKIGDVPAGALRAELHRMADWIADYREHIGDRRIVPDVAPGDVARAFPSHMPETAAPLSEIIDTLDQGIMPGITHWGHPAFLGYFGSTSNGPALLGEMAAAALNVSAMTWKTSPAATELETVVLSWIRDLIGLPPSFDGVVYDTASIAILHALAAARERALGDVRRRGLLDRTDAPTLRVYASDQAHSSVEKAMVMLGLGEENVVRIGTDDAFAADVDGMRTAMERDVALGARPMAVVATVGTTSTASIDPVRALADLAARHGAWLHVDAAYGGALGALPEARAPMDGVALADSVVVNPHKWLFVPLDFSALYLRDRSALSDVFANTPEYLAGDAARGSDVVNYMDFGVQLGRRFRALKAWAAFNTFGRAGIEARIREHCRLAQAFGAWVRASPGFELSAPVSMGIVCFRSIRSGEAPHAADERNRRIVERVNASGTVFLTHTSLRGRTCMRVGFGNIATTEAHALRAWNVIVEASGGD